MTRELPRALARSTDVAIARAAAVIGVLSLCFAVAALKPLLSWTRACAEPSITKEDCSPTGKANATDWRHVRHALGHPLESARFTVMLLLP